MRIGLLTFHYANNFGALLQCYALLKIIKDMGFEPIVIDRRPTIEKNKSLIKKLKTLIELKIQEKSIIGFEQFRIKYLQPISEKVDTQEELLRLSDDLDAIIVGSDQVWRLDYTKGMGYNYFLDFAAKKTKKIAYAASFGKNTFNAEKETIKVIQKNLKAFHAISVREDSGVDICRNYFGISAAHVIDPTLLLKADDYIQLISEMNKKNYIKQLTHYVLDPTDDNLQFINDFYLSNKNRFNKITNISGHPFSLAKVLEKKYKFTYPSFSEWLLSFYASDFIITDSFHGIAFSIIFNKQFLYLNNSSRGMTRVESLLTLFNLNDRIVMELDNFDHAGLNFIDYEVINKKLMIEREKSIKFLENALKND